MKLDTARLLVQQLNDAIAQAEAEGRDALKAADIDRFAAAATEAVDSLDAAIGEAGGQ